MIESRQEKLPSETARSILTQAPPTSDNGENFHDVDATRPSDKTPDGGVAAWSVAAGVWCTSFCSFGWITSIGSFQQYYQNILFPEMSPSTVSWIPSLQLFFMMGTGPIVGRLYDSYGPRYLLLGGTLLHVFGLMMTSLGTKYYQILLAQGVCSAIGVAAIFQPALNTLHAWFDSKRGLAFGVVSTGSSVGGVIFPIMVSRLIDRHGFGWAMRICAFMVLGLLAVANLTVRQRVPSVSRPVTMKDIMKPFREVDFVLVLLGLGLSPYGVFIPINYLPAQSLDAGMSASLTPYILPILNAGSLFGRVLSGLLADKIGRYNTYIIVCYLSTTWILALWIPANTTGALVAFACLYGFSSGAYVSLISPLVAQISPMPEVGFRTGLIFFGSSIGGLTTSPIAGAIRDGPSGWLGAKVFAGCFFFGATTFILIARIRQTGLKAMVWA